MKTLSGQEHLTGFYADEFLRYIDVLSERINEGLYSEIERISKMLLEELKNLNCCNYSGITEKERLRQKTVKLSIGGEEQELIDEFVIQMQGIDASNLSCKLESILNGFINHSNTAISIDVDVLKTEALSFVKHYQSAKQYHSDNSKEEKRKHLKRIAKLKRERKNALTADEVKRFLIKERLINDFGIIKGAKGVAAKHFNRSASSMTKHFKAIELEL